MTYVNLNQRNDHFYLILKFEIYHLETYRLQIHLHRIFKVKSQVFCPKRDGQMDTQHWIVLVLRVHLLQVQDWLLIKNNAVLEGLKA